MHDNSEEHHTEQVSHLLYYKIPMGNSFQYRIGDCNFKSFSYYKQKGWEYKNYHEACDALNV